MRLIEPMFPEAFIQKVLDDISGTPVEPYNRSTPFYIDRQGRLSFHHADDMESGDLADSGDFGFDDTWEFPAGDWTPEEKTALAEEVSKRWIEAQKTPPPNFVPDPKATSLISTGLKWLNGNLKK